MEFPCEFSIKVMGEANTDLDVLVTPIISKYVADIESVKFSNRKSAEGKYESLTYTFTAESQEQLDSIYREVTALPSVLMAL